MKEKKFLSARTITILSVSLVLVIIIGVLVGFALRTPEGILPGVTVNGTPVGGMSREEAVNLLTDLYEQGAVGETITYRYEGQEVSVPVQELSAELLVAETIQAADAYGKQGNIFTRLSQKWNAMQGKADLPLLFSVDEEKVKETIAKLTPHLSNAAIPNDHYLDIENSSIVVVNGTKGQVFDSEKAHEDLMNRLGYLDFSPIDLVAIEQESKHPSAKELAQEYEGEPQNATYEVVGYRIAYQEGTPGVIVDQKRATEILEAHTGEGEKFSVPVTLQLPEIDVATLEEQLFGHQLSTYTTRFNTSDRGRSKNVALASEKINGTILAPGAVFSYNEVVGERTTEQGFQIAKVYSNGQSVDGIGGGICQVSSTLYNTALYANLEIVSRRNHQLPVSYVPLGQDATVVYGATDFQFKNSTNHPIKIVSTTYQGTLTVSIYGTPHEKKTEVTITNETVGVIPYSTETVIDDSLPFGEERKEQSGASGYTVNTYIRVTEDGVEVRNERISTSTYNAKKEIIAVSSATEPPLVTEAPTEGPGDAPTEESGNLPTQEPADAPSPTANPAFNPPEDEDWGDEF